MSNSSWLTSLRENIQQCGNDPDDVVLFVGVGQERNGDDGVGPAIIRELESREIKSQKFHFINAGAFPENKTSSIRKLNPALLIFIDAAQMDLEPGDIRYFGLDEVTGLSAATHSLPFGIIGQYLKDEVGCRVMVLGIQPVQNQTDTSLSRVIIDVVQNISNQIEALAKEYDNQ